MGKSRVTPRQPLTPVAPVSRRPAAWAPARDAREPRGRRHGMEEGPRPRRAGLRIPGGPHSTGPRDVAERLPVPPVPPGPSQSGDRCCPHSCTQVRFSLFGECSRPRAGRVSGGGQSLPPRPQELLRAYPKGPAQAVPPVRRGHQGRACARCRTGHAGVGPGGKEQHFSELDPSQFCVSIVGEGGGRKVSGG